MKRIAGLAACATVLFVSGCTNDITLKNPNPNPTNFIQVQRTGKSLVETIFSPWANHQRNNTSPPSSDPAQIAVDVNTFTTGFAGRSAAIGGQAQSLLGSNVLVVDLSAKSGASFLGVESGGKINTNGTVCGSGTPAAAPCTAGLFGGRGLGDDIGATLLGIAFGPTIPQLGLAPDDMREQSGQNGTPLLSNDNVTAAGKHFQVSFPYLGVPR